MSETDETQPTEDQDEVATASSSHCRHCGQPNDAASTGADWLCPYCERYQDAMQCPTCNQGVRISLMPEELAPTPHAPARRRK